MPLERLTIYHVSTPLSRPYCLSFGVVNHFDSFIALATFANGTHRLGESTPLPGYSHETAELLAREYGLLARQGKFSSFLQRNRANPFVTAPILTCLDPTLDCIAQLGNTQARRASEGTAAPLACASGLCPDVRRGDLDRSQESEPGSVPSAAPPPRWPSSIACGHVALCPILQWNQPSEIADVARALAAQRNQVAKVKLTANLEQTRLIVHETIRAGQECGLRFRYDANGALDRAAAETVACWLDDPTTELLEQPFPASAWEQMESFYSSCPVPLMLDEPIVTADDVFRAAGCADYIKLKLAKNGSPGRLLELIRQARECGLQVILGNGAQGTIGCWLEGQVQLLAGLTNPGEMNGFRKLQHEFLPGFLNGTATGFTLGISFHWTEVETVLKAHCLRKYDVPVGGIATSWNLPPITSAPTAPVVVPRDCRW